MSEKVKKNQLSFMVSLDGAKAAGNGNYDKASANHSLPYFCTTSNIQSAVVYLSQELQGMGLSCGLIDTGTQKINLIALINACWEVIQLYRSSIRDSSTLQDQRRRDVADINHYQNSVRDLRGTIEEKDRVASDAQEKERQAVAVNKALASKLKSEKDEVRRLGSALQQHEAHHQHELRKKEIENSRLKERLHRLVSGERTTESKASGMTISNTLSRSNKLRAKWKTQASGVRHEEDLYRRVLSQYEAWVGQLNDENDQLKSCLSAMTSQIAKLATRYKSENYSTKEGDMNSAVNTSVYSTDSLDDPMFSLDFPSFRGHIQQVIDDHIKTIGRILEEKSGKEKNLENIERHLQNEVHQLQMQITKCKDQIIPNQLSHKPDKKDVSKESEMSFLKDGECIEELAILEKEKESLAYQQEALQKERQSFSDAAIRLNREKAVFEAEKVELLRRQFLQDLPSSLHEPSSDAAFSGNESTGSVSSGSIGEVFSSPQRILAIPNITPPRGNITINRSSEPVVLGPTTLPKQHRSDSKKTIGSSRRL